MEIAVKHISASGRGEGLSGPRRDADCKYQRGRSLHSDSDGAFLGKQGLYRDPNVSSVELRGKA